MAGAAANTQVFFGKNYTYATTCPSLLYVRDAFRSLATFKAKRVAVIRDRDDPICLAEAVNAVSASSSVELYGYYDLDPTAVDYEEQIYDILVDLNANQVESVMGCSYLDLCIYVSFAIAILFNGANPCELCVYFCVYVNMSVYVVRTCVSIALCMYLCECIC